MKNKSYIGISLVILVFGIWAVYNIQSRVNRDNVVEDKLNEATKKGETSDKLYVVGKAPDFKLTDQNNKPISNKDYQNKAYVVEFFFTTCPTICPKMNANMLEVEKMFFGNPNFGIASITIDPEHDTPKVLKDHAELLGVKSSNWHFLTGDKEYIYSLANKGFKVYAGENVKANGGFEHQGYFALVDKDVNIRCRKDEYDNPIIYYDGVEKAGTQMMIKDIKILLNE